MMFIKPILALSLTALALAAPHTQPRDIGGVVAELLHARMSCSSPRPFIEAHKFNVVDSTTDVFDLIPT